MKSCADWSLALFQWTVKRLGSFYTLALPEGRSRWCIHADENVFVADNIPPQNWAIEGQEGGLYTSVTICLLLSILSLTFKLKYARIVLSTPLVPQRAWTLDRPEPQSLVRKIY